MSHQQEAEIVDFLDEDITFFDIIAKETQAYFNKLKDMEYADAYIHINDLIVSDLEKYNEKDVIFCSCKDIMLLDDYIDILIYVDSNTNMYVTMNGTKTNVTHQTMENIKLMFNNFLPERVSVDVAIDITEEGIPRVTEITFNNRLPFRQLLSG